MAWVLRLVEIGAEGEGLCADVMQISRPDSLIDIADLGLTLAEAKLVLAGIQREIVAAQARVHAVRRPACRNCGAACRMKDYRRHEIATLFGQVTVRLPRFCCAGCGTTEAGVAWPPFVRSTPELDRLRPQLSALMTYRTAAALLGQMFPVNAGQDPETLRRHTFKVAETLPMPAALKSATPAEAITLTLDATFIRSCEDSGRHLEVRIGNVETATGRRQVFGAVAKTDTDLATLIRGTLDAVRRTRDTALTALTDGCPGLRRILLEAGITELPILDWFHLAMRLQHLTQVAGNLSSDSPECAAAKAVIIEEVERLRWRLWNGKAQDAGISLERIQAAMPAFQGEPDSRRSVAPSRKLWTALGALNDYLVGQSDWLVNYAERHRAGLRVGTALTEGTANFLVNRRMAKAQQMRWTRRGADRLLRVRCAVYNGTLGTGFGQRFQAATTRTRPPPSPPEPPTLRQSRWSLRETRGGSTRHQTVRAVLLARATVTSILGLRASIPASHNPAGALRWPAQRTTALAPRMSKRRMVRSPIFETAPNFCLPPVDFYNGTSPNQAAKSRPARKPSGAGTRAMIAVAAIGPMPGIVMSRRATGSAFARRVISASSTWICASSARKVLTSTARIARALSGTEEAGSSTRAITASACVMPWGKT